MTRVAYLSPLPPDASGIADYSAELLSALAEWYDIDVFSSAVEELAGGATGPVVRMYGDFLGVHRRDPYDAVVYQLGNNVVYHGEIYRLLQEVPGIVVLHEFMLYNLIRSAGAASFVETMAYCYGERGAQTAREMLALEPAADPWAYPLFERAVDASCAVVVHNDTTRRRVRLSRPGVHVTVVPHPLSLDALPSVSAESRKILREELGVPEHALVVASFGTINRAKRIGVVLRAFARFRREHPDAVFVLAGAVAPDAEDVTTLLEGEMGRGVIVTGRESLPRMLALMDLADVAVNLRHPTGGETSGTCIRLLGLGTPVIVSAGGWFSEIPDGCCSRVAPGPVEEEALVAALNGLGESEAVRREMGAAAAAWAHTACTLDAAVKGYAAVIDHVARVRHSSYVEPLPPLQAPDIGAGLVAVVAAAAADIAVADDETTLLPALAETLVELGLAGDGSRAR